MSRIKNHERRNNKHIFFKTNNKRTFITDITVVTLIRSFLLLMISFPIVHLLLYAYLSFETSNKNTSFSHDTRQKHLRYRYDYDSYFNNKIEGITSVSTLKNMTDKITRNIIHIQDSYKVKGLIKQKRTLNNNNKFSRREGSKVEHKKSYLSNHIRRLNLEIISRCQPIDLMYFDVSYSKDNDLHRGARDELGKFGYIHNETFLHANPPHFHLEQNDKKKLCKQDGNYKMLSQKVVVDFLAHQVAEEVFKTGGRKRIKIFCTVYTIKKYHHKLKSLKETWLPKCDGYMIASDKTDKYLGTVNIAHEGTDTYNNIWQKLRSIWSYIYDHYYDKYDYFHIGGDDLYVIVENLRLYLESDEIRLAANGGYFFPNGNETHQYPLYLGRRFAYNGNMDQIFNSGGSGYTLNKAALKALVIYSFPTCMAYHQTFAEDVMVAQCLRQKLHIYPYDTKDNDGGERYMPFQPVHHLMYKIPEDKKTDWYAMYSIDIKEGLDHCSHQSVAFHYIDSDLMRKIHAILYGHCL